MKVSDVFVRMALDNKVYRRGLDREEGFTRQRAMIAIVNKKVIHPPGKI